MQHIINLIEANRNGSRQGLYSICSAHPLVIQAALQQAKKDVSLVLIEATANQVNQYGGYTGMKPKDFVSFVHSIAKEMNFPISNIILGGDHLGPVCWTSENASDAMEKSKQLIREYAAAGFKKIHLDASMPCADDPAVLSDETVAERASILCQVAEKTAKEVFGDSDIVYVIGTEVPPPGGADEEIDELQVTGLENVKYTLDVHQQAFENRQLQQAWLRVIAIVVQPGVEFGNTNVIHYQRDKARALTEFIKQTPQIVYEAHSTDYQHAQTYRELVEDHFAILKVGPQLTFAMREAIFALCDIENQLFSAASRSNLKAKIDAQMEQNDRHWRRFYDVPEGEQLLYRHYSYSDRIRYYWTDPEIQQAFTMLIENLTHTEIPLPLLSQYLPAQYDAVSQGDINCTPDALIIHNIMQVTERYAAACRSSVQ